MSSELRHDSPLPRFIAAGEALTDMIRNSEQEWLSRAGGAPWNVARVMASLGVPSAFAGAISQDCFGDELWTRSLEAGLDPRFLQRYPHSPLLAIVHSTQPPQYFFVGESSADLQFDPQQLPAGWAAGAQWALFGGISLTRQPLAGRLLEMAATLKTAGARICYDPNFRVLMDERYDATLERMVKLADVIKVSDEDLAGLFRSDDIEGAFARLRSWNPDAAYLYTRGGAGASLHQGTQIWQAKPPRIEVVDTVGAGDASAAGLMYSLMQRAEQDWPSHLRFAVAAGSAACMTRGAVPPSLEQVQQLYQRVELG
jgi:fructokinase